ncbi:MAG: 4-hydroxy-tetrahydrodipicolinate reductase, partial [Planctomycetia bacterium]
MSSQRPRRLVVHGAAGRMGQRIIACAAAESAGSAPAWQLVAADRRAIDQAARTIAGLQSA